MGQSGGFDARREGVSRHHGTAHRDRAGLRPGKVGNGHTIGRIAWGDQRTKRNGARCTLGATTRRHERGFTEQRNIDQRHRRDVPEGTRGQPLWRTPGGNDRGQASFREQTRSRQSERDCIRQDERGASLVVYLPHQRRRVEGMMQHQCTAAQQPRHQRKTDAGKRGGSKRRLDDRMGADAAFQQDCESARHQFGMTARNRYDAAFAELERDHSDVGGGISPLCDRLRRRKIGNFRGHQIAERYHPVGRIFAEAAYIANGKHIGGDVQGALGLRQGAYSVAADDDLGADTRQRRREFAPAEEDRQGGDRHPGTQHAEHRQKFSTVLGK